jgi:hypothetical protein
LQKVETSSKRRGFKEREEAETTSLRTRTGAKEGVPNPEGERIAKRWTFEKKRPSRKKRQQINAHLGWWEKNISPARTIRPWHGGLPDAELLARLLNPAR